MFRRTVLKLQHRFFWGVWTRKKQHSPVAHGINLALMMEANQPFAVVFDRGASLSWWIWRIKELGPSDSHESYARLSTDRRPKEKRGIVALKAFKVLQVPKFKESLQRVWVCIYKPIHLVNLCERIPSQSCWYGSHRISIYEIFMGTCFVPHHFIDPTRFWCTPRQSSPALEESNSMIVQEHCNFMVGHGVHGAKNISIYLRTCLEVICLDSVVFGLFHVPMLEVWDSGSAWSKRGGKESWPGTTFLYRHVCSKVVDNRWKMKERLGGTSKFEENERNNSY